MESWTLHTGSPAELLPGDHPTMVEMAFRHLRDAILNGDLRPGDRVRQDEIAAQLKISRIPLREALRMLEQRDFVTIVPRRGAFVTKISVENVREIYFIRTALEAANAALAARYMDGERLGRLNEILESARRAYSANDHVGLADLNREFHLVGHAASVYSMMLRLITDLSIHCQRYRLLLTTLSSRTRVSLDEHEQIYRAWADHDEEAAAHWIQVNLENSGSALIDSIQQDEGTQARPVGAHDSD